MPPSWAHFEKCWPGHHHPSLLLYILFSLPLRLRVLVLCKDALELTTKVTGATKINAQWLSRRTMPVLCLLSMSLWQVYSLSVLCLLRVFHFSTALPQFPKHPWTISLHHWAHFFTGKKSKTQSLVCLAQLRGSQSWAKVSLEIEKWRNTSRSLQSTKHFLITWFHECNPRYHTYIEWSLCGVSRPDLIFLNTWE